MQHGQFPPVMLTTDEPDVDPDQLIQYGREFKKRYIDDRDGIPVVGAGLKAIRTGFTPEDLALIDSQKLRDTHILQITGVPEGLLSDKANRANAEAARLTFYATTVQDEADAIADRLGFGLERAFGSRPGALRVTAPDLTPTDAEQQSRIDRSDTESGLQSINEIRRRRGLDPVAGGDVHMVSAAMVPLESASTTPPKEDEDKGKESKDDEDEGGGKKPERSTRSVSAILHRATRADATEAELSAAWKRIDRARRRAIAPTEMEARRLFAEQGAAAVAVLESLRSADGETRADDDPPEVTVSMIFDLAKWTRETLRRLGAPLRVAARIGHEIGAASVAFEGNPDAERPTVKKAIAASLENAKSIPETTARDLGRTIRAGVEAQESLTQLTKRVQDVFTSASAHRARTIAQTTGTAAFEAGQHAAWEDAEVTRHRWLSQRDGSVRDSHRDSDGQVRGIGETFDVGGAKLRYPGDPLGPGREIIGCRCTRLPVGHHEDYDDPADWTTTPMNQTTTHPCAPRVRAKRKPGPSPGRVDALADHISQLNGRRLRRAAEVIARQTEEQRVVPTHPAAGAGGGQCRPGLRRPRG